MNQNEMTVDELRRVAAGGWFISSTAQRAAQTALAWMEKRTTAETQTMTVTNDVMRMVDRMLRAESELALVERERMQEKRAVKIIYNDYASLRLILGATRGETAVDAARRVMKHSKPVKVQFKEGGE